MHWCPGINSSHHIYAPPQEYQCSSAGGILQAPALGPGSILVVFYYPLLSHRQYTVCGVHSSVNNSTLCAYACTLLGQSYTGHCQHFHFSHRQYSWTIICETTLLDLLPQGMGIRSESAWNLN